MTEAKARPSLPMPTREQLRAWHSGLRETSQAQEAIDRVNAQSGYTLLVSREGYLRTDRPTAYHATRYDLTALCGKTPNDAMCIETPEGTPFQECITCDTCRARVDQDYQGGDPYRG